MDQRRSIISWSSEVFRQLKSNNVCSLQIGPVCLGLENGVAQNLVILKKKVKREKVPCEIRTGALHFEKNMVRDGVSWFDLQWSLAPSGTKPTRPPAFQRVGTYSVFEYKDPLREGVKHQNTSSSHASSLSDSAQMTALSSSAFGSPFCIVWIICLRWRCPFFSVFCMKILASHWITLCRYPQPATTLLLGYYFRRTQHRSIRFCEVFYSVNDPRFDFSCIILTQVLKSLPVFDRHPYENGIRQG